jgi:FkbM family methyltransferase
MAHVERSIPRTDAAPAERSADAVTAELSINVTRIGTGAGSYAVHADLLTSDSVVYSAGVGRDVSFDRDLIERFGLTIHAFDPTPASIVWMGLANLPQQFQFHRFGLAGRDGLACLRPPAEGLHGPHTILRTPRSAGGDVEVPVLRLGSVMRAFGHTRVDLLKLDIEGAEYAVIRDLVNGEIDVRQIVFEVHDNLRGITRWHNAVAIRRLRRIGYRVFHTEDRRISMIRSDVLDAH